MDPELGRLHHRANRPGGLAELADVDWIGAQAELDECDGYIVLAVDPQTGEVDAHGPFSGRHALDTAVAMRSSLDGDELTDVVVRVVRWHRVTSGSRAA